LDVDAALIQLDSEQKYLAEIAEIGVVSGSHPVVDGDLPYTVKKRGISTGVSEGVLQYLHVDGVLPDRITRGSGNINDVFHRYYTEAMSIESQGPDSFCYSGDSGSAIVNSSGEIVGILFGGGDRTFYATPIQQIEAAFDISVVTATAVNAVRTVPATAGASADVSVGSSLVSSSSPLGQRLHDAEMDITATPAGERYSQLFRKHFPEAAKLVNDNRRVATAWHRNGGPQLLQNLLQSVQSRDRALPEEIDGKPLSECLAGIQNAFKRYGSPQLAADLDKYAPHLARLAGLTYPQALDTLRNLEIK
jgi:hypothetical protein